MTSTPSSARGSTVGRQPLNGHGSGSAVDGFGSFGLGSNSASMRSIVRVLRPALRFFLGLFMGLDLRVAVEPNG
jgi:hypothetical protein